MKMCDSKRKKNKLLFVRFNILRVTQFTTA